ncbi:LytTR family transcriptional regulator [Nostoc ellipsosporum NOK]|uniref:LytTR family DNA-binding domain-containing protein n=1 Tax=Sphingomonas sp. IBVSS2 TaxID=1985172 RepID=UPI000A2E3BAF|nr:LytTR family DNA-binding domain-containing protein [Sphingomonas sp. IBVSS2]MDF2384704.1 LytTR family transcriptional regulator [Nostoc ellipsosporum NOK]OSZ63039.1 histidine kinase [Sphingomonas sp. IBVSS2]
MDGWATGWEERAARRWSIDIALLVAFGLLMGFLGPFASERLPVMGRYVYWMICMVGGGLIGVVADDLLRRRMARTWRRIAVVSVLMTPFVSLLVLTTEHLLIGGPFDWRSYQRLLWQVWPILLAVLVVRTLVWRRLPGRIETRTIVAPPLPEAEATFRRRLSAKRRAARLIAIEAHDHYLKVHTDAGEELITLRFADALNELARAHGWRVHRSWWVAADAVEDVRWRRGAGEIRLAGGLVTPVSRTYAPTLKEAGWF